MKFEHMKRIVEILDSMEGVDNVSVRRNKFGPTDKDPVTHTISASSDKAHYSMRLRWDGVITIQKTVDVVISTP